MIGVFLKLVEVCCLDIMIGWRSSLQKSGGLEPFLWLGWLICIHCELLTCQIDHLWTTLFTDVWTYLLIYYCAY